MYEKLLLRSVVMKSLYFAPINIVGNYIYRHLLLELSADFVFSELLMVKKFDEDDYLERKLKIFPEDVSKTIFQIGAGSEDEIVKAVKVLNNIGAKEINVNMGCPHSTFIKEKVCCGILFDKELLEKLCGVLFEECFKKNIVPSIKLRIGTSQESLDISDYLKIIKKSGIKKVYIHARSVGQPYFVSANFDAIKFIKKEFSGMELIYNGDIDCYEMYEKVENYFDGVMIGRAALINPFVFDDIRNKRIGRKNFFEPVLNDLSLVITDSIILSEKKRNFIIKYLDLATLENLSSNSVRQNLAHLLKGVSHSGEFFEKINVKLEIKDIRNIFKDLF